ncbi:MAG: hypothetical protein QXO03_00220 [Thermoplasmatales archaeon]
MKVGVLTKDFRIYNRLMCLLKNIGQPFVSLRESDRYSSFDLVLTDMDLSGGNVYKTDGLDEFRIRQLVKSGDSHEIVVGIDPGPMPGIATLANNIVIDRRSIYDVREIRNYVLRVNNECSHKDLIVKIGDGDRRYRNQIIRSLYGFHLQIVDEKGSSRTSKRGDDSRSAVNIALSDHIL